MSLPLVHFSVHRRSWKEGEEERTAALITRKPFRFHSARSIKYRVNFSEYNPLMKYLINTSFTR
jgi:hypothetical protein